MPNQIRFLGVSFTAGSRNEVLQAIHDASPKKPLQIATLNPEIILEAQKNTHFREVIEKLPLCTIDGSGLFFFLKLWSRLKKLPRNELYHGSDLVADLFEKYQNGEKSFYFLGGPPGLTKTAKEIIQKKYPSMVICGESDGGILDKNNIQLSPELKKELQSLKPDIILVGFGAPKQELWMDVASKELEIPVMIGVGGTLWFYTERRRAPQWMRSLHLEWLDRSLHESGHWKRAWQAVIVFSFKSLYWMLFQSKK